MNYIFFGTPEFAAIILEKLIKTGLKPALLICNPDKPVGRKKILTPPPTKIIAQKYGINFWQPEKLTIDNLKIKIKKADFAIIAAYSKILPKEVLEFPRLGTIGIHPSLLPKYRGPSPIQSVLLNGEKETGLTLFLTDEKIDHGPILVKQKLNTRLEIINYEKLMETLAKLGADLLIKTLPKFIKNGIKPKPQNENEATHTKKFKTEDAFINPLDLDTALNGKSLETAIIIERKIRALNPEPSAWTFRQIQDKKMRVKLLGAEIIQEKLKLKTIQIEGKKPTKV